MAQSGFTPISLYYSSTASATPTAGNLVAGELAINTADGKLFYKDSSGVVQTIATKGAGTVAGSTGYVQYNNAGALGASSSFYWDITNSRLGIGTTSPAQKLQVNGISRFYTGAVSTVGAVASSALLIDGAGSNGNISQIGFGYDATATYMPAAIYGITTTQSGNTAQDIAFATRSVTTDTAPTERMRIDSSGQVGIGVTPSAWTTSNSVKALQVGNTPAIWSYSSGNMYLSNNSYYNGTNRIYSTTATASEISLSGNQIQFGIAPSGTAGTAVTFTQAMTLDSNGNLLVGTSSLNRLGSGSSGTAIQLNASGTPEVYISTASVNSGDFVGTLNFGTTGTSSATKRSALIASTLTAASGTQVTGNLVFYTNSAGTLNQTLAISPTGSVALLNGVTTANGVGITFPATQSASSDANTLDDYEEGTFTPTLTFGGGSTGLTYTTRVGRYTKVGNLVTVFIRVTTANSGSSTGSANISGLPFVSNGASDNYQVAYTGLLASMSGIVSNPFGQIIPSDTTFTFYQTVASSYSTLTNTNFPSGCTVNMEFTYIT